MHSAARKIQHEQMSALVDGGSQQKKRQNAAFIGTPEQRQQDEKAVPYRETAGFHSSVR